ncbi:hypothetical protein EVA_00773 [gut metagenome]|uniref:Uncharacterized protein n=1 Tax=gut metagenome TaxID=749906 RepID=J9H8D0_9ZZZZ
MNLALTAGKVSGIGLCRKIAVGPLTQSYTEMIEGDIFGYLGEKSHTLGIMHGHIFEFDILATADKYAWSRTGIRTESDYGTRKEFVVLPRCLNDIGINLLYPTRSHTNITGIVNYMLGLAIESNTPTRHNLPPFAADHEIAVSYLIVNRTIKLVGNFSLFLIILKYHSLCDLRHTGINGQVLYFHILTIDNGDRQHSAMGVDIGTSTIEGEVIEAFQIDSYTLGVILVVIGYIISFLRAAYRMEVIGPFAEDKANRTRTAFFLDLQKGTLHQGSCIFCGIGHDAKLRCIIHFLCTRTAQHHYCGKNR